MIVDGNGNIIEERRKANRRKEEKRRSTGKHFGKSNIFPCGRADKYR